MTTFAPQPQRTDTAPADRGRVATRPRHSVRLRIVLGYTLLLLVSLIAATLLTHTVLLARLDREIDRWQEHQANEFGTDADNINVATGRPYRDEVGPLFDEFLSNHIPAQNQAFYTYLGNAAYRASLDAPAAAITDTSVIELWTSGRSPISGEVSTADGSVAYRTVPVIDSSADHVGTFVVATYPDDERSDISTVVGVLALVGALLVTVSIVLALSLARRILQPVRRLTDTAMRIEDSDLSARIPLTGDDELTELGRTFNSMLDRLEDSFRSQRAFLDDVAHELRTPITIVRGHLELLDADPVEHEQTIALVTDELDRMSRSVDELLVLAKSGRPDFLHPTLVDVHDLLDGVLTRARALGPRAWSIGASPRPAEVLIVADPDRLTQALLALATNAVDHSPPGSPIVFAASAGADQIVLSVSDRGSGIDPSIRDHLFTRFTRAATSEAGRPEGLGLGLAIVSSIAAAHGGSVDVRSTVGKGSTFRVFVPRKDPMEDVAT